MSHTDPPSTSPDPASEPAATDTPIDHTELIDHQIVERYLTGRLAREEADRFERHYLDCPICLELLEVTESMLDGFRHNAARDAIRGSDETTDGRGVDGGSAKAAKSRVIGTRSSVLRLATAAAAGLLMVIAAGAGWHSRQLSRKVETLESRLALFESPQASPIEIFLSPLRDSPSDGPSPAPARRLRLPTEPRWLWLTLELGPKASGHEPEPSYSLEIRDGTGDVLWRADALSTDAQGLLKAGIPSTFFERLGRRDVILRVESSSGRLIADFPLRITP